MSRAPTRGLHASVPLDHRWNRGQGAAQNAAHVSMSAAATADDKSLLDGGMF